MTATLTFLLTDIEGSTERWEQHPDEMRAALARHDDLVRQAVRDHGGRVFKSAGDGLWAVFDDAGASIAAAVDAVQTVETSDWGAVGPLRIRVGLHQADGSDVEERDGDFFGPPLNRCARLVEAAHGGQILASDAVRHAHPSTTDGWSLRDLGAHRLRDLREPQRIHQVVHPDLPIDFPPIASLEGFPNNLPVQRTSFVGREAELAELAPLVRRERLATLTGVGGAGKTRLALALAAEVVDSFPDGAWFVDLSALRDPDLVPQAVATTLELREQRGRDLTDVLVDFVRERRLVLVLDNCEHVIGACARLADRLLVASSGLHIIATSRERLGVAGENVRRVGALPVADDAPDDADGGEPDAVRLFLDRASAVAADLPASPEVRRVVARICRRLDGIPLAIELAAARLPVLTPEEIESRLDDRFRLLTGGGRTRIPHHRTLRAAIDWSHDLLDEPERILFRRLAVFAGPAGLDAVEAVAADEHLARQAVLDTLSGLVDKSLVTAASADGITRYGMLQTVREYARQSLVDTDEEERIRDAHARWVLKSGEAVRLALRATNFVSIAASEHDVRAALDWLEQTDPQAALRLATDVAGVWWTKGLLGEGRHRLERALELAEPDVPVGLRARATASLATLATSQGDLEAAEAHARDIVEAGGAYHTRVICLWVLGVVSWARGDLDAATARHEEGIALARELGHGNGERIHQGSLARVHRTRGDLDGAEALHRESLDSYRRDGDRTGAAEALDGLARVGYLRGDLDRAAELVEQSRGLYERAGYVEGIASTLTVGAAVALASGEHDRARRQLDRALSLHRKMGHGGGLANTLEVFAALALAGGRARDAATLLGAVESIRDELGEPPQGDDPLVGAQLRRDLRDTLGDEAETVRAAGAELDADAAVDLARAIVPDGS